MWTGRATGRHRRPPGASRERTTPAGKHSNPLGVTSGRGTGTRPFHRPRPSAARPSDTRERARPEGRTRWTGSAGDQCSPVGFSTIVPESFAGLPSFGIVYAKNARPVAFLITSSTRRPKVKVREASSRIGVSMKQR